MTNETKGYWVGPMPIEDFLDDFLPADPDNPAPSAPEHFSDLDISDESSMYSAFQKRINEVPDITSLTPGHFFVDGSNHPDKNSETGYKIRIDGIIYQKNVDLTRGPTQYDALATACEFKKGAQDIVKDDGKSSENPEETPFELTAGSSGSIRGQLAAYATEVCSRQHRCHFFMIFVFHPFARLLRWDRSGVIVSQRFDYDWNSQPLVEFLWRFAIADLATQGVDPTVEIASKLEETQAKELLKRWAPKKDRPVFKMEIHDLQRIRHFLVWGSVADPYSPLGRATRGYPAVEVTADGISKDLVFLKEQWRSIALTVPEVEVIRELNEAGVRHVPTLECGGDLRGTCQRTQTQTYASASWRIGCKGLDTRFHTRFITREVGVPLKKFPSSRIMMQAAYDAIIGHQDAYEKCNYLHRDVSAGNILILDDRSGMLNDWDLAMKASEVTEGPRKHERTGTWPFMSISILSEPSKAHGLHDDLESFFWVVLYHGLLYSHHTYALQTEEIVHDIFHSYVLITKDGQVRGGRGKSMLLNSGLPIGAAAEPPFAFDCEPLTQWFNDALNLFDAWLSKLQIIRKRKLTEDPPSNYADVLNTFTKAFSMDGWPANDSAVNQIPKYPQNPVRPQKRSIPGERDNDEEGARQKRSKMSQARREDNVLL